MFSPCGASNQSLLTGPYGLSDPQLRDVRIFFSRQEPFQPTSSSVAEVTSLLEALLPRLHVLIVGPGLGRETHMQAFARLAIQHARERGLYLVLDADALLLVQDDPDIIRGYPKAVITPNVAEFAKICDSLVRFPPLRATSHAPTHKQC